MITILNSSSEASITLLKVEMKSYFNLSMFPISLITAIFFSLMLGFSEFCQKLIDRYGLRKISIIVGALAFLGFLICALSPWFGLVLIPGSVLLGFCCCCYFQIALTVSKQKSSVEVSFAALAVVYYASLALLSVILAQLDYLYTWKMVFLLLAAFHLNMIPIGLLLHDDDDKVQLSSSFISCDKTKNNKQSIIKRLRQIRTKHWIMMIGFSINLKNYANFKSYMPFYLQEFYGATLIECADAKFVIFSMVIAIGTVTLILLVKCQNSLNVPLFYMSLIGAGLIANILALFPSLPKSYHSLLWILFAALTTTQLFRGVLMKLFMKSNEFADYFNLFRSIESMLIFIYGAFNGCLYDYFGTVSAIFGFSVCLSVTHLLSLMYLCHCGFPL